MPDIPLRNDADPQWQEMHAAAGDEEANLFRAIYIAFGALAARRIMQAVRAALRANDVERAVQAIPTEELVALAATIEPALYRAAVAGAHVAVRSQPVVVTGLLVRLGTSVGLPVEQLESWARAHAADLVRDVTEETRRAIRQIITEAVHQGRVPRETARLVESIIGLTRRQALAVRRYGEALLEQQIPALRRQYLVQRYGNRLLRHRARTIARHETLNAANEGRRSVWERDARAGLISRERWEREWVAIVPSDGRTCRICQGLDGQRAPISGSYPDGRRGPPAHTLCRCTEKLTQSASATIAA